MGIKEHKFLTSLSLLLSLISMGMVSYIFLQNLQQKYQINIKLEQQIHQNQILKNRIEQEKQNQLSIIQQIHKELADSKSKTPTTDITHLIWLVREAKWQINLFNQSDMAIKLLNTTQNLVSKTSWKSINDTLAEDIAQIQNQNLTNSSDIIQTISEIKHFIEQQKPTIIQSHVIMQQPDNKILQLLNPYIKISQYQNQPQHITTPTDQIIVLNNLLLLLPEIQLAALNHQNDIYQKLIEQFNENLKLLPKNPRLNHLVENLKLAKIQIDHPLNFHSLSELEHILQTAPSTEE